MAEPAYLDAGATFDSERRYRYRLWRTWDRGRPSCAFVMLNPSTADETQLDPTLRRCLGFAQAWGYGGFEIGNLFALRATDPKALYKSAAPIGPNNDAELVSIAKRCELVVAGWGVHGKLYQRDLDVMDIVARVRPLHALRLTKDGAPGHPLYLPASMRPEIFMPELTAPPAESLASREC